MWIEISNAYARVVKATQAEKSWLREYLSFRESGFFKRKAAPIRMLNEITELFPAGFVPMVQRAAAALPPEDTFPIDLIDQRVPACKPDLTQDTDWLNHHPQATIDPITHQRAALEACLRYVRGILWMPTASGKTEVAIALAKICRCRWVYLVSSSQSADQAAARFTHRTGEAAGTIGEGAWNPQRFTAATFQTLYSRSDSPEANALFAQADGLIVNESHTLPADSFWKVAMRFQSAYWRIGMSGTPLARGDRRSILSVAALGPVIFRVKPEELINIGVLARPKIRLIECKQPAPSAPTKNWAKYERTYLVESQARNALVAAVARHIPKPGLVFVKMVEHGQLLTRALQRMGLSVEFLWGDHNLDERKAAIRRLVRGDLDLIVCSVIFNQDVDIPELRAVVNASGGKSIIATLQKLGRGGRTSKGKVDFEVWDFADRSRCDCTKVDNCPGWHRWLQRHTKIRLKAYASEGYSVQLEDAAPLLPFVSAKAAVP